MSINKLEHYDTLILEDIPKIKTYANFEFFTVEECEAIKAFDHHFIEGKTSVNGKDLMVNNKKRITLNAVVSKDDFKWLYDKARSLSCLLNKEYFQVDIFGILENALYMKYNSNENLEMCGFFDWHKDVGDGYPNLRKLTMVVSLSDPSDYEGGDLHLFDNGIVNLGKLNIGCGVIFPSYIPHRVTKVTNGSRETLVFFISGPRYR